MCYSALVRQAHRKLAQALDAEMDVPAYEALYARRIGTNVKLPKAMDDAVAEEGGELAALVAEHRAEQAAKLHEERGKQAERQAKAQASLAAGRVTKKAQDDLRISTEKLAKIDVQLADLERTDPKARDSRIFPGVYSAVVVQEGSRRLIRPMRYQCRPDGKPAFYDAKFPGTYNARRDNLGGFWKGLFGQTHGLIVATHFYENVEGPDGQNVRLEFAPRTGEDMLIACLWSHWSDQTGKEPSLYSFAAITDEPEPEVAAAGHDRTIINIKPEHVDAWLAGGSPEAMHTLFEDKRHPYYEHRLSV